MRVIKGQFNQAIIYNDQVDEGAIEQIRTLCDQPFTIGSRIRVMPDVHAGAGCTIGTTMTITDKVVPNMVGVDIGCGMEVVRLREVKVDFARLDALIRAHVPSGRDVRKTPHPSHSEIDLNQLRCAEAVNRPRAVLSIGTLGGGNHFIEIDQGENGALYLVIHSGSRHMGLQVANHYQELAFRHLPDVEKRSIPKALAYVKDTDFENYIHDMRLTQLFADLNRKAMADVILKGMDLTPVDRFTTIHNYIETGTLILRKGAVSAKKAERFLLPINMRDGSLILIGKGNPDWNYSAPHGAGRLMSRTQAFRTLTLTDYQASMKGIFTTSVNRATLDECPMAYKDMENILENITQTAEVVERIRPLYNFKAAE